MNTRSFVAVTAIVATIFGCGYAANSLRDAAADGLRLKMERVQYPTDTSTMRLSSNNLTKAKECAAPHREIDNSTVECK